MASDVITFIKALGYSQVNLLGFSMGGFVAQQIVETDPQLVNKLILTGTGPQGSQGLAEIGQKVQAAGNLSPQEKYLHFLFAPNANSRALGEASFARTYAKKDGRDPAITQEGFVAELTAVIGWAQPDPEAFAKAKTVTNPVLIIGGQDDFFIPVVNMLNLSQAMANSRLLLLPATGHAALNQYPALFIQETTEFLKN
jgi:pimeloyl-ACP methyl ester carboxylesterase